MHEMTIRPLLLLICITIFSGCGGQQVKSSTHKADSIIATAVIRSIPPVAVNPDYDTTLISQYIRSIFEDSKGNMWFGTLGEGVARYRNDTLQYYADPEGFISKSVHAITEDKNGNIWIGTDMGVYTYDGNIFKNYNQTHGLAEIEISRSSILVDRKGTIWLGTKNGIYIYNPEADKKGNICFSLFSLLPAIKVADIFEDNAGNIWFASADSGIYSFDGNTVIHFNQLPGLGRNYAGGIAQDPSGNMWFLMQDGICKFDGTTFTSITQKDGLAGSDFWGILIEASGIIWITARGSTTRYNPALPSSDPKAFTIFTPGDGLNCCVQSMFHDRSGRTWLGAGSGVFRFDDNQFIKIKQQGPW
ncbi:MAG TPA: two-component regulator propeller domain-containing protein, partial [Chitinophagales bacterium]|nr:two-component regulator propeller domain-containing protein [Chitinophagales bacterium]